MVLPEGVQLHSEDLPEGTPPVDWHRSWLRARLLAWRTAAMLLFAVVVLGSVYIVGNVINSAVTSVRAPGMVISQEEFRYRGNKCALEVEYVLDGRVHHGTVELSSTCLAVPGPGSAVTLNVYPSTPDEFLSLVGHDASRFDQPWPVSVGAILAIIAAGLHLLFATTSYRRARFLGTNQNIPWRQVTATVQQRERTQHGTRLGLQAPGPLGEPQTFNLWLGHSVVTTLVRPYPGQKFCFRLKSDGGQEALFHTAEDNSLRIVGLFLPPTPHHAPQG